MTLNTEHLKRCIQTLKSSFEMLESTDKDSVEYEIFRNAVVKGFELTLETSSKILRKKLKPFFATPKDVDKLIFKDIFRYAAKHSIITTDEAERWFSYRDNRNNTAHDYGKGFAEETLTLLFDFIKDAKTLQENIENDND